tara:strand:+ start:3482 stop:3661 length:180 start_codon:yes stop_codon:yes gene_type:complete
MEIMKMIKASGERNVSKNAEIERRRIAMRFVWMPGRRPVIVPAIIPKNSVIINSKSINL